MSRSGGEFMTAHVCVAARIANVSAPTANIFPRDTAAGPAFTSVMV
jgi:hypothetical protein